MRYHCETNRTAHRISTKPLDSLDAHAMLSRDHERRSLQTEVEHGDL